MSLEIPFGKNNLDVAEESDHLLTIDRHALRLEPESAREALEALCAENEALKDETQKLLQQLQISQCMQSAASKEASFHRKWFRQMSSNPGCEACAYRTQ